MPEKTSAAKPVTQKRLMNIALYYLGRYESSAENVRRLLDRRIAKAAAKGAVVPPEAAQWVDAVVAEVCRSGYVDDERFARSAAEKYRKAGKSERAIRLKLTQAGIAGDIQDSVLKSDNGRSSAESELAAALRLVEKRKIGSFRPPQERKLFRKKDLAVLARAGFSFQTAVQALGSGAEEEDDEYRY